MGDLKLEFKANKYVLVFIVIISGTILRFLVGMHPPNFDFYSWEIVSNLFLEGKSIYANTTRYNYGPIWFNILGLFRKMSLDFRFCIISFLTFIDFLIFLVLWKMDKIKESILFYLCPISIIISGYHHQFENFAIFILLLGLFFLIKKYGLKVNLDQLNVGETLIFVLFLGLSLTIKHIFILFPIWLFFQTNHIFKRLIVLVLPLLLFFAGFYLYWEEGKDGIINNVFKYASFNNFPFYQVIYADFFYIINNLNERVMRSIFMVLIILIGFLLRKRNLLESFLLYSACFVCFSPAIANQYLSIPVLFLSFYFYSSAMIYYMCGAIILFLLDSDGLRLVTLNPPYTDFASKLFLYKIIVTFLFINILSAIYNKDYFSIGLSVIATKAKEIINDVYNEALVFFRIRKQ